MTRVESLQWPYWDCTLASLHPPLHTHTHTHTHTFTVHKPTMALGQETKDSRCSSLGWFAIEIAAKCSTDKNLPFKSNWDIIAPGTNCISNFILFCTQQNRPLVYVGAIWKPLISQYWSVLVIPVAWQMLRSGLYQPLRWILVLNGLHSPAGS